MKRSQRAGALMNVLRSFEAERHTGCPLKDFLCDSGGEVHSLLWHHDGSPPPYHPSALSRRIGQTAGFVAIILSHFTDAELYNAMQVNMAWGKEAVRLLWHSPVDGRPIASSLADEDVASHATLMRHLEDTQHQRKIDEDGSGYSFPFSFTCDLPVLPRLTSIECRYASLGNRTVEKLNTLFVPTIKTVFMYDYADRDVRHADVAEDSRWFKLMSQNCHHLEDITLGVEPLISTKELARFLQTQPFLKSISLSLNSEHLLVDGLAPYLESFEMTVEPRVTRMNKFALRRLPKIHALEYLKINFCGCELSGNDPLPLQYLQKLTSLWIVPDEEVDDLEHKFTGTAAELLTLVIAMPNLEHMTISTPCDFLLREVELYGDESCADDKRTWCWGFWERPGYLEYLRYLADEELKEALSTIEQA
ncbi:hypothetical protein E4T42_04699 [Aureobasidium subglaciale]|nr:hypothetical protein E4T42_04699 [Aureobasidium subglaciale]